MYVIAVVATHAKQSRFVSLEGAVEKGLNVFSISCGWDLGKSTRRDSSPSKIQEQLHPVYRLRNKSFTVKRKKREKD